MVIFGIRIMRERTGTRSWRLEGEVNRWRYEYERTAEMRAELMTYKIAYGRQQKLLELIVADMVKSPRTITVKPVAMGVDSGVRIEVDQ